MTAERGSGSNRRKGSLHDSRVGRAHEILRAYRNADVCAGKARADLGASRADAQEGVSRQTRAYNSR
jgi:hypothetical protein